MTFETPSSPGGGSGVRVEREARAIVVKRHDAVIASSERALLAHGVREAPVYYVPVADVYMEHLTPADDGAAAQEGRKEPATGGEPGGGLRLFSVTASGGGVADAAWIHRDTSGELASLAGHVGFDPAVFNVTAG